MIADRNTFADIECFIEHVKQDENVVGIVEYGGRKYWDMSLGGDYDLTIIYDKPISNNFSGIHFHIQGIPVDCMILSIEDFKSDSPSDKYLLVHLNCTILYDKDNKTAELLNRARTVWSPQKSLSDFDNMIMRFTFKHILDKLKHRLHEDPLYSKYFIFSQFDWFLTCYAVLKGWEPGKTKEHLNQIMSQECELYQHIRTLYSSQSLDDQYDSLIKCAEIMTSQIGGLWGDEEILFHLNPDGNHDALEQKIVLETLIK